MSGNSNAAYSTAIKKINNTDRAVELLESKELILRGQSLSLLTIHDSLLHLAHTAAPAAVTLECLVAFSRVIDTVYMDHIASEVVNKVCHKTMLAYNVLDEDSNKLEQLQTELDGYINWAKEQVHELEQYQKNVRGEIEKGMAELVEALRIALTEIQRALSPQGVS
ncbi:hypothetical protein POSPLADRAFT_1139766 [Postia placenta MAD-698-R-SB12]|uniref:Uncharacterized protein n=1 Tax=Postia placenta MAD-698-R-SB12 TaxID=670580 RepID=A0A1X6N590_9APHY|nr:hypothetical protein POSPLADRAFT_1139766 [Postia placenta MAD-698-R-SB12]OSX63646.1 hypothetical protein POSPLADRAFT_1139766 [Postia placenta MAD-698-R-SB12]